jgi:hypothetical protein
MPISGPRSAEGPLRVSDSSVRGVACGGSAGSLPCRNREGAIHVLACNDDGTVDEASEVSDSMAVLLDVRDDVDDDLRAPLEQLGHVAGEVREVTVHVLRTGCIGMLVPAAMEEHDLVLSLDKSPHDRRAEEAGATQDEYAGHPRKIERLAEALTLSARRRR